MPRKKLALPVLLASVSPAPPEVSPPTPPSVPRHGGTLPAASWVDAPSEGYVAFADFWDACRVTWQGAEDGDAITPAQVRAGRVLLERGQAAREALLDALFEDLRSCREGDDFPRLTRPDAIPEHVPLESIRFLKEERAGVAYTYLSFSGSWREEHGLIGILHGARVIAVGGYGDHNASDDDVPDDALGGEAPTRTADGARVVDAWVKQPHDGKVALPMWEGLSGRWDVVFATEDDDEDDLHDAQQEAATRLVSDGDAIRAALASRLAADRAAKTGERLADDGAVLGLVRAGRLLIHTEEWDGLAYTALTLEAPWRKSGKATVVLHGARAVALTTKAGVDDAILEDQDAMLRARRAAKAAKTARGAAKARVKQRKPRAR